ncbi:hypothetical protein TWF730_006892 [Orbilia blumenaviensis]|uniref:Ubiquitin carboxyl-terminal hydrolase n=1 Tax=Orbilia blumenaviensis TaxID=1796055 RepID=A0AAV9VI13_9PEZI
MNHHQYSQMPPHGPYIPQQMMGPPPHHHHAHQHQHQHQQSYPHHPQHVLPYSQHPPPPHPSSQAQDYRPHFHQPNRPLIVSTPASYIPQYPPPMMPHHMPNTFYRPSHLQPNVQPYYPAQEIHSLPPDIPSPASLPHDPVVSNPASSPARSTGAIEELGETKFEISMISSSPVPHSPMIPRVIPLRTGNHLSRQQLPWYSAPGKPFPLKKSKVVKLKSSADAVLQQTMTHLPHDSSPAISGAPDHPLSNGIPPKFDAMETLPAALESNGQNTLPEPETPATASSATKIIKSASHPAPAIPIIPFIPAIHKPRKEPDIATSDSNVEKALEFTTEAERPVEPKGDEVQAAADVKSSSPHPPSAPPLPPPPKSWADLVRPRTVGAPITPNSSTLPQSNGSSIVVGSLGDTQTRTLSEVLQAFTIPQLKGSSSGSKVPFIEPRGLINTGNMCFMNSILQALLFCGPFFMFLDAISRNVIHNFKSETPMIDAMILFMREFRRIPPNVISSNDSSGLDTTLSGDPFVPEYVYEAVRGLKRFSSMRRGHQQDAEEFLNFFLDVLHEECVAALKSSDVTKQGIAAGPHHITASSEEDDSGWLEVGHKQKAAITRNIGHISGVSPVTKIFGGQMRNELRVAGQRNSVMREPYQSLQLDIQGSNVHSIVDALRQISIPEQLQGGDFKSARGASASATKQAFIDSLPPVLILHLKRFQYNNAGGTQKIWKSIGYPLELEIPSEALSPTRRSTSQLPQYKLISVVYHHGKSATNGHYTVDVNRQDGWIRIDDTVVKRITGDDVVVDDGLYSSESRKGAVGEDNGWKEVSSATKVGAKATTATNNPPRDDKVAYLLFYELL